MHPKLRCMTLSPFTVNKIILIESMMCNFMNGINLNLASISMKYLYVNISKGCK